LYLTGKVTLKSVSKLLHWKTNWLFWQQSFYPACRQAKETVKNLAKIMGITTEEVQSSVQR